MYILGIDFGTKKLGLALLEDTSDVCSPLPLVQNDSQLWVSLQQIVADYRVTRCIIGLPSYPATAKKVKRFVHELHVRFPSLSITYSPEDNTSIATRKELTSKKQKENLDSYSAIAILQQWASTSNRNTET